MNIEFASYGVPVILTVVLGLIYRTVGARLTNQYKPLIAVSCGIALGMLAIVYKGEAWWAPVVIDHAVYGLMLGASAIGLYELQRTVVKPRK